MVLSEGGNVTAVLSSTGEDIASADKIDLRKIGFGITDDVTDLILKLNSLHNAKYGEKLWEDESIIHSGYVFNGSFEFLFREDISNEDLLEYKPEMGDIDVTVPDDGMESLLSLLKILELKKITSNFYYVGSNVPNDLGKRKQINSIFRYYGGKTPTNVQMDFESSQYVNGYPTKWAKFSHSSSWEDAVLGIKGFAHKLLIKSIVRVLFRLENAIILTPKSKLFPPGEIRVKKNQEDLNEYSFSVSAGMRKRLAKQFLDGKHLFVGGKRAYKDIPTSESEYIADVDKIFEKIFSSSTNYDPGDIEKFWSFSGILDLMNSYFDDKTSEEILFSLMSKNLWGPTAQGIDRYSWKVDYKAKLRIAKEILSVFPQFRNTLGKKVVELSAPMGEYYANYRERTGE